MSLTFSLDQQKIAFQRHLDEPRNQRVIFSGVFGIGKTYFLHDYFSSQPNDYVAIKLSPVNYSVSTNEDIFRIIKYDILFELLATHHLEFETKTISREVAYGVALEDKIPSILNGLVSMAPILNKDTTDIATVWATVSAILPPFLKKVEADRKDPNLNERIKDFGRDMDKLPMLEEDFISIFIEKSLDTLSAKENRVREKVLVIDDLDRIDPEHIFRLFNVFSAHLDYNKTSSNKFGFDKVVFVCDIHNIRNIFHSRYGAETDFTGYIDKFYSQEIYHFDNSAEVKSMVAQFMEELVPAADFKNYFTTHINPPGQSSNLLSIILTELIHAGALTIRRLQAVHKIGFSHVEIDTGLGASYDPVLNISLPIVIILQVLIWILGGTDALDRALKKLRRYQRSKEYSTRSNHEQSIFASALLPVLDYKGHSFRRHQRTASDTSEPYVFVNPENQQKLSYQLLSVANWHGMYVARLEHVDGEPYGEQVIDLFGLIHQTFVMLQQRGVFR